MAEMKSAYELAMERMGGPVRKLSAAQKSDLTEADRRAKARLAEAEIMSGRTIAAARERGDAAEAALAEEALRREKDRIQSEAEAEKEQIRNR
jgi:hypothetical protein